MVSVGTEESGGEGGERPSDIHGRNVWPSSPSPHRSAAAPPQRGRPTEPPPFDGFVGRGKRKTRANDVGERLLSGSWLGWKLRINVRLHRRGQSRSGTSNHLYLSARISKCERRSGREECADQTRSAGVRCVRPKGADLLRTDRPASRHGRVRRGEKQSSREAGREGTEAHRSRVH